MQEEYGKLMREIKEQSQYVRDLVIACYARYSIKEIDGIDEPTFLSRLVPPPKDLAKEHAASCSVAGQSLRCEESTIALCAFLWVAQMQSLAESVRDEIVRQLARREESQPSEASPECEALPKWPRLIYEKLQELKPLEGMTGKQMAECLFRKHKHLVSDETVRKNYINKHLRPLGVRNRRGVGYYISKKQRK